MDLINALNIDTSGWPVWLVDNFEIAVRGALILLSIFVVWLAGWLVKRTMCIIGRRRLDDDNDEEFEGSAWDIGSSIARFGVILLLAPLPLQIAGFDAFAFVRARSGAVFAAALTLLIAIVFATWLARSIRRFGDKAQRRSGAGDTLFAFMSSLLKYIIFAIAVVLALTQLGMETTSLVALLGAAGLAIGLALQDTLKAVAAGVMLAVFRPFRIGDWVEISGLEGAVADISPFQTSIIQVDNKVVFITNDRVWSEPLINYTRQTRRRLDLYFDISYDDDMGKALKIVHETTNNHGRVLAKDETWTSVHALGDFSVKIRLRAWVPTREFVPIRGDITKAVKEAFDAAGITIPYPHQVEIQYQGQPSRPTPIPDQTYETPVTGDASDE